MQISEKKTSRYKLKDYIVLLVAGIENNAWDFK